MAFATLGIPPCIPPCMHACRMEDDDDDEAYSDDEDVSWKVRRAAVKLLTALIALSHDTPGLYKVRSAALLGVLLGGGGGFKQQGGLWVCGDALSAAAVEAPPLHGASRAYPSICLPACARMCRSGLLAATAGRRGR